MEKAFSSIVINNEQARGWMLRGGRQNARVSNTTVPTRKSASLYFSQKFAPAPRVRAAVRMCIFVV